MTEIGRKSGRAFLFYVLTVMAAAISSALDLGCAKGYLVKALISSGISAKAYDISEYALSFTSGLPCYKYDIRNGILDKDILYCKLR